LLKENTKKDSIYFRIAKINEISLIEHILQEAYQPIVKTLSRLPGALIETKRKLIDDFNNNSLYSIIQKNNNVIGTFSLRKININNMKLYHFAILPSFQHQGFGKIILNQIKHEIKYKHHDINILIVEVYQKTPELRRFYEKDGFFIFDEKTIEQEKILIFHHCIL